METTTQKNKLLLHICCAGCGAYVSRLLKENFQVSLFFYNSNIFPQTEYDKRREEVEMIAKKYKLDLLVKEYNHADWLKYIKGLENEAEKGQRCFACYKYRMTALAEMARDNDFDYFSTTLSVSPYKVYRYIKEIGDKLASEYNLQFHDQDYKKQDGALRSAKLSKELGLYRQNYCGCEFSYRD